MDKIDYMGILVVLSLICCFGMFSVNYLQYKNVEELQIDLMYYQEAMIDNQLILQQNQEGIINNQLDLQYNQELMVNNQDTIVSNQDIIYRTIKKLSD